MQQRTRVKICGITSVQDAYMAIHSGVDALGLVFYAKSPRAVSIFQANEIVDSLPPFISAVGLFVDAERDYIKKVIAETGITVLQFHGEEQEAFCASFNRPYFKALRVHAQLDIVTACQSYPSACGILLDTHDPALPGGTGRSFDWSLIPEMLKQTLILAGGLNHENVQQAIMQIHPYAVDVSGGVEKAKGKKEYTKIRKFMSAARKADFLLSGE